MRKADPGEENTKIVVPGGNKERSGASKEGVRGGYGPVCQRVR